MRLSKFFLQAVLAGVLGLSAQAASYGSKGRPTIWKQGNGHSVLLNVFGDEMYARSETLEGYTILFNKASKTYFYAQKSWDGTLFETHVPADERPPEGIKKHLTASKQQVDTIVAANKKQFDIGREARWRKRVQEARFGAAPAGQLRAAPVAGKIQGLTILVQFPDDLLTVENDAVPFPTTAAKMQRFFNADATNPYTDDGNAGSVRQYFLDQSAGKMDYTQIITPIVTLPRSRAYYNEVGGEEFGSAVFAGREIVRDAVRVLQSQGFNFSGLTTRGDGEAIATNVFFAGQDSGAWTIGLWPHAAAMDQPIEVASGIALMNYQITNIEDNRPTIGTFIHESGHLVLDFPDLYDYGDESWGLGLHCLMSAGNHADNGKTPTPINLAFKEIVGWAKVTPLSPATAVTKSLPSTGNVGYRYQNPKNPEESFIVENRGPGDKWAAAAPDHGLMIWHVDNLVDGNDFEMMTSGAHYQVSLEQSDGRFDLESGVNPGDSSDAFDLTSPVFSDDSAPNANWWTGTVDSGGQSESFDRSGIEIKAMSNPGSNIDVRFGPLPQNRILITSPNNRETVFRGATVPIMWDASISGNVRIELLQENAERSVALVIAREVTNSGLFQWNVPSDLRPRQYRIRISSIQNPVATSDVTDQPITVALGSFPQQGLLPVGWVRPANMQGSWHVTSDARYEGKLSIKSGAISDGEKAGISYTSDFAGGVVSFYVKVSSETGFDKFRFMIDGTPVQIGGAATYLSGDVDWQYVSAMVPAGRHTLTWLYAKDDSYAAGSDAAWIDGVVIPRESQEITVSKKSGENLRSDRSEIRFAPVPLTRSSRWQTIRIKNTGRADLRGIATAVAGRHQADFVVTKPGKEVLAKGESTTFRVKFAPKKARKSKAVLRIFSNDSDEGTFSIALAGRGKGLPELRVFQPKGNRLRDGKNTIAFGSQAVGSVPEMRVFTLTNTSRNLLKNLQLGKSGANAGQFRLGPLGVTELAQGESTTFRVYFMPKTVGTFTAKLQIFSNDYRRSPFDVKLTGRGVPRGTSQPAAALAISPADVDSAAFSGGTGGVVSGDQGLVLLDGGKFNTLAVEKPSANAEILIEVSGDRVNWFSGPDFTTTLRDNDSLLKVRDNVPLENSKRFIRSRMRGE